MAVLSLAVGAAATAAPVLSVNAAGPCPTQASSMWTATWLTPPAAVQDETAVVTDFVREMLMRLGAPSPRSNIKLGCDVHIDTDSSNELLLDVELQGLGDLMLARWSSSESSPVGEEAARRQHFGQFGSIGGWGREAVMVVLNERGGS